MACAGPNMILPGALQILDAAVSGVVEEPQRNDPPASPSDGASFIIGTAPTPTYPAPPAQGYMLHPAPQ